MEEKALNKSPNGAPVSFNSEVELRQQENLVGNPEAELQGILKTNKSLKTFRIIALMEGISFLVLLGIAMPLKYMAGFPIAVRITGSLHGLLFVLFVFYLFQVRLDLKWDLKKTALAFIASLLPFGTFVLDSKLLKNEV